MAGCHCLLGRQLPHSSMSAVPAAPRNWRALTCTLPTVLGPPAATAGPPSAPPSSCTSTSLRCGWWPSPATPSTPASPSTRSCCRGEQLGGVAGRVAGMVVHGRRARSRCGPMSADSNYTTWLAFHATGCTTCSRSARTTSGRRPRWTAAWCVWHSCWGRLGYTVGRLLRMVAAGPPA